MPTNIDVVWPIQTAIYSTLTGDAALTGDITGVFDEVPEGQAYPYISIGEVTVTSQGAHDRFGARSTITLHGWSTYHGKKEITALIGHLLRLLDQQTLEVDGHHTVAVRHEQTVTQRENDTDIRHAAVRFAVETEHA